MTATPAGVTVRHPVFGAALWMAGALLSFMSLAVGARELSSGLNTFQILFWRSAAALVLIVVLLSVFGWRHVRTRQPGLQVGRNLIHFCGQFGWIYAIAALPLAQVFAIEFTTPVWTLLLAALFLGEAITRARLIAVLFGFVGILIILRPGFEAVHLAQFAVMGSALAFAFAYVTTKKLVATDAPLTIIFYMPIVQLPLGLVTSIDGWVWPAGGMWLWIALIGMAAVGAHYSIARALELVDATVAVPMDFLRLPLSALIGFLAYAEILDIWVLAGAVAIFAGNYVNVRAEARR